MSDFCLRQAASGVWYGQFDHFRAAGLCHGISTRLGGAGEAPFWSLNLGMRAGDEPDTVRLNRRRFCEALGVDAARLVGAQQVHSDTIKRVTAADAGRGADSYETAIPGTDALITNEPGVPLLLLFADCVPVIIYDPVRRAVGVSHAGWKGTVARIAQKTVLAMGEAYGTRPGDCLVGIGPSIGPCCYEVDDTVINPLQAGFSQWQTLARPHGDRRLLDLWLTNRVQLEEAGVPADNIKAAAACTACNTALFFSHRAERGKTGRLGAMAML